MTMHRIVVLSMLAVTIVLALLYAAPSRPMNQQRLSVFGAHFGSGLEAQQ